MPQTTTPRIVELAERLADDIASRGLAPGDPYLATAEAARLLGVRTHAANRAMQLLVKRQVLERRQRLGTFVGPGIQAAQGTAVLPARVHLVVHRDYLKTEGLMADGVIVGLQEVLPAAHIQFNFLPADNEQNFVDRLIATAARNPEPEGFVLVRSPLVAQRRIEESGLPAVIFGTPYPSIARLPWIDRDQHAVGRLLVEHMLAAGARQLAVLLRDRVFPGDHLFLDGIQRALAESGLGPNDLRLRCLPADPRATSAALRELLDDRRGSFGVICRSEPLGNAVLEAAEQEDLRAGGELHVGVSDLYGAPGRAAPFPYVRSRPTAEQVGARIGEMLRQAAQDQPPENIALEVQLVPSQAIDEDDSSTPSAVLE